MIRRGLLLALLSLLAFGAAADIFRPAYLELRELGEDRYQVTWKVPSLGGGTRLSAYVVLPENSETLIEPRAAESGGAWTERWTIRHAGGLVGERIRIEGNAVGVTDVIARVERLDGSSQVERLAVERPEFVVEAPAGTGEVAWTYTVLGVEHILLGWDHLAFVLALLLIVPTTRALVWTITAFTLAHSVTLVAASLGWVHVPGPPVEAVIALSIVFVASEVLHGLQGRPGITARAPWLVALSFGLLHGLGFAGALAEIGLPQNAIPLALATFNIGVELGQLMFVAAVLLLAAAWKRLVSPDTRWATVSAAYVVGSVAAFWTIERVVGFWPGVA
ncbi:MAG: HupE/UreJ family protein [Xanthomonadales bacterium]|nr:HupE/UreJ family protein [Xanthomonadales bacterium]